MKKYSPSTLFDEMNKCHESGNHRYAVIVFSGENWPDENYSEKSRSYRTYSDQWGWGYNYLGRQRLGSCLDGTDDNVRLDRYDWKIEYWYWEK